MISFHCCTDNQHFDCLQQFKCANEHHSDPQFTLIIIFDIFHVHVAEGNLDEKKSKHCWSEESPLGGDPEFGSRFLVVLKAHSHFVCYNETSFNTSLNPTNLESIGLVYNIFHYLYQCDGAFALWSAN